MNATTELFDRFIRHGRFSADSAAAAALGVKAQTVSNWRRRGSQAEPRLIEAMCLALGEHAAPWVLRAQAEQAHDPANRRTWREVARQLGIQLPAAALVGTAMREWLGGVLIDDGVLSLSSSAQAMVALAC